MMPTMQRWEALQRLNVSKGYHPENLVGTKELAELIHVGRTTITSWNATQRGSFATPIVSLANGPVYDKWEYLLSWLDWTPNRPSKSGHVNDAVLERLQQIAANLRDGAL